MRSASRPLDQAPKRAASCPSRIASRSQPARPGRAPGRCGRARHLTYGPRSQVVHAFRSAADRTSRCRVCRCRGRSRAPPTPLTRDATAETISDVKNQGGDRAKTRRQQSNDRRGGTRRSILGSDAPRHAVPPSDAAITWTFDHFITEQLAATLCRLGELLCASVNLCDRRLMPGSERRCSYSL
jgi:hypothetical protein